MLARDDCKLRPALFWMLLRILKQAIAGEVRRMPASPRRRYCRLKYEEAGKPAGLPTSSAGCMCAEKLPLDCLLAVLARGVFRPLDPV